MSRSRTTEPPNAPASPSPSTDPGALGTDPALLIPLAARAESAVPASDTEREAVLGALGRASGERLRQELERILLAEDPRAPLQSLLETGVLEVVLPELTATASLAEPGDRRHKDVWEHTKQVVAQCPARPTLRWAALLHDIGKVSTRSFGPDGKVSFHGHAEVGAALFARRIAPRLVFPEPLARTVGFLIRNHPRAGQYEPAWQDSAVRRFAREMGDHVEQLLDLARADVTSRIPGRREAAVRAIDELAARVKTLAELDARIPPLPSGLGNAIMERFALPGGPGIGRLRRALEAAVEQGHLAAQQPVETYLAYLDDQGLVPDEDD